LVERMASLANLYLALLPPRHTVNRHAVIRCSAPPPIPSVDVKALTVGTIVAGRVLGVGEDGSYELDIGTGSPATMPRSESALLPNATRGRIPGQGYADLSAGEVREALVVGVAGSQVNVSVARAQRALAWRRVESLHRADVSYNATVIALADAGATVEVERLPGFVPWSHWQLPEAAWADRKALLGSRLPVKFLEVDAGRNRLVVSHRRHAVQQRLDELSPGRLVTGRVAKLVPFGAVVRLADGLEGLLHVSQVSRLYVQNVSEVLTRGEELTCVVLKVDLADGSLALSTKMLESRPGEMLDDRAALLARSSQIEGRVELRQ